MFRNKLCVNLHEDKINQESLLDQNEVLCFSKINLSTAWQLQQNIK